MKLQIVEEGHTMFEFVDGHADTITVAMGRGLDMYKNDLHIDFSRLALFTNPVQVFTVFCADKYLDDAYGYANAAIDYFEKQLAAHADIIALACTFEDIEKNASENKASAVLALEGGEPLAGNIGNLDHFYRRGVRLITLTWNRENDLGYGAMSGLTGGLKPFGVECVKRMDELGVIIDVSHLNEAGFWDVDRLATRPYIASHSNAHAVTPVPRNLKDDQIGALVECGGVIGINMCPPFLAESGNADVNDIFRHIKYFIDRGAAGAVGLGCDLDGIDSMPEGMTDVTSLKGLARSLAAEFGADAANAVMFGNFSGFFKKFFSCVYTPAIN